PGTTLADYPDWPSLIDAIVEDDTTCLINSQDALLSTVNFVGSALINKNLDLSKTCSYLEYGVGDAVPTAASTAWVLEIDPELGEDERREIQHQIRLALNDVSDSSDLTYAVASLDLMSYDIDQGTFENLTLLILFATLVVIALLFVAFRNVKGVLFPVVSLNVALIFTYGFLNVIGIRFTALEVAVAPLVLGLGIDYAIHLQRSFAYHRNNTDDVAEAWMRACGKLSVPLSLAVVTTVAAFLANLVSPLPPLSTFGIALAFGVICAFLTSTLLIGALHVTFNAGAVAIERKPLKLTNLTQPLLQLHRKQQVAVLLVAIAISGASVVGAMQLETDFDLSDFVNEDMEIMSVRDDINSNYESAGWKYVYVLMEPVAGGVIPDDVGLLDNLRTLHSRLENNYDVVGTNERFPSPSYEGPYVVLRDAIMRNASFGEKHDLELDKQGDVWENALQIDLGVVFADLQNNYTVADPITGKTWSDRVNSTVHLDGTNIAHLRTEVRVEATTSTESKRVVTEFESMVGSTDEDGTLRSSLKYYAVLHVTGDLVVLQQVLDGLSSSQLKSTAISLVVSFAVLLLLTRRILPAFIVLLPVGMASLWVVGSMAVLGLKWNVLTVLVTALTLGIGIDYTIHMWRRIEWELQRQDDHWSALKTSLETTGVALMLSAATTAAGFLVLMLSPMPVIQDFGLITAVTVFFSLVLALVLLPVLLELAARAQEAGENGA
ncbi:MAG: MMPL family transporter, partial [Candidatus Thermoplasmatota archaeon]|nr:MMPL family transporter [Candidatus Thermoplasmatota archaeon]